jgi:hypothetical protein
MYIILSQRRDIKSQYRDRLFTVYHFPPKYKNQIHTGDKFIYYQGDRYSKANRYYYGTGKIGKIYKTCEDNYYAELIDCKKFNSTVSIYAHEGYIETFGYEIVRKSPNPPWQSSIRPLSYEAAKYILDRAIDLIPVNENSLQIILENELKEAIRAYYRRGNQSALKDIIYSATQLTGLLGINADAGDGKNG